MYSYLIKNGTIIDGTGKPGYVGSVAVSDNVIVEIGPKITGSARNVFDAEGLVVTPGFIDSQNHSDSYWQLFENPELTSLTTQGFTTIMVGHCGASLAPLLSRQGLLAIQKWRNASGNNTNWTSFKEYANHMSKTTYGCNVGSLVGYSTLRRGLLGDQVRSIDSYETEILKTALADSLSAGAFGLSTGLSYAHEIIITELELYELAKVVAEFKSVLSVHLRSEANEVVESVEEAIDLASHAGVSLKISHLKIRGNKNWEYFGDVVDRLETAYHRGTTIAFDVHPYDSIWYPLYTYLPKWSIEGGRKAMLKRFKDEHQRAKMLSHLHNTDSRLSELIIASTALPLGTQGKKIGDIARNMELTSEETILEILQKSGGEVMVFDKLLNYEQVEALYSHPLAIIATDGAGFSENPSLETAQKLVHPRCFGTTQKFLGEILKNKLVPLETAIQKLTGKPAQLFGLEKRGVLSVGNFADITILNPQTLQDRATLINPYRYGTGIEHVLVNGIPAVKSAASTGKMSGTFLKKH